MKTNPPRLQQTRKRLLLTLATATLALSVHVTAAPFVVQPVDVTSTGSYSWDTREWWAINGAGLWNSGDGLVDTGDPIPAVWPSHQNGNYGQNWQSGNPPNPAWIRFDLGQAYSLNGMRLWNLNQAVNIVRGIRSATVSLSLDGTNFTTVPVQGLDANGYFYQAPGTDTNYTGETYSFSGTARYVQLTISSSWIGDLIGIGISEVRFIAAGTVNTGLPAGAVAWWPGEGNFLDLVGGHNGVPVAGVSFAAGEVGQCFNFTADGDAVTIPHDAALNVQSSGFSVEFWMQGVKNQPQSLFLAVDKSHGWVDSTGWLFQGYSSSGQIFFGIGAGGSAIDNFPLATSTTDMLDGQWHHVAGTWDGTLLRIFVDGGQQDQAALTTPFNNTRPVNLGFSWGGGTPTRFFRGKVDQLALFARALAPDEIAAQAGVAPPLTVSPAGGGVLLSWPAAYGGHGLFSRSSFTTGTWEIVTNTPATNGMRKEVLLPAATPAQRFFRLQAGN